MKRLTIFFQQCSKRQMLTITSIMCVALISALSVFYYYQYQKLLNNPQISTQHEITTLKDEVGKLMELPEDEQPIVATVTDQTALAGQNFFQKSQNGDKLLIYSQAKLAILYRPSENKIIMVAPLNIQVQEK